MGRERRAAGVEITVLAGKVAAVGEVPGNDVGPVEPLDSLALARGMTARRPLSGYSKGARGLSVFPREHSIFTVTTISLRPSLRQEPNRYAIHETEARFPPAAYTSGTLSSVSPPFGGLSQNPG